MEEVCGFLRERGVDATRYHAGLSEAERQTMYRALALVSENLERIYTHKKTAGDRAARDEQ